MVRVGLLSHQCIHCQSRLLCSHLFPFPDVHMLHSLTMIAITCLMWASQAHKDYREIGYIEPLDSGAIYINRFS